MDCRHPWRVATALAVLSIALTAQAAGPTLSGRSLQVDWRHPLQDSVYLGQTAQVTVGAGTELPGFLFGYVDLDLDALGVTMTVNLGPDVFTGPAQASGVSFNGFALVDAAGTLPAIVSATLNPSSSLPGVDASRLSFDADHVVVNLMGLSYAPGQTVRVDVALVPEPSTTLLCLAGAALLVPIGLRRRATARGPAEPGA